VLLLVLVGGGAAVMLLKKKPVAEDGEDGAEATETPAKPKAHAKSDHPPTFVPLDPFTVNLADKDVDRFAQVGVTLQVEDPKFADQIKAYMPAIRSKLLTREGKEKLAKDIMREAVRPMGIELDEEDAHEATDAPKKKKKKAHVESPISQVLFSNFIVQ
jgi:flagellar FliL protein